MKWRLIPDWAYMIRMVVGGCVIAAWILIAVALSGVVGFLVGDRAGELVAMFMTYVGLIYVVHAVGDRVAALVEEKS